MTRMAMARMARWRWLWLVAVAVIAGCAEPPTARAPRAPSGSTPQEDGASWVCRGLVDHFVGLPSAAKALAAAGTPPIAGRWWIRRCSVTLDGPARLRLSVDGPGWYWVDSEGGDIELHQQVPFELSAEVTGAIRAAYADGVASLWFEPTRPAKIGLKASRQLELHGATPWGSILRRIPLLPVRAMTADRLSQVAAAAFRARLDQGLTVTYDVFKGQADMALGHLALGETPKNVFDHGPAWLANERLLLPPVSTHAFGPLQPTPLGIDVVIEAGQGLAYRAVCTRDMAHHLRDVAAGKPERIPAATLVASGRLAGSGPHTTQLEVDGCPYYLVVSNVGAVPTVAALRLRG